MMKVDISIQIRSLIMNEFNNFIGGIFMNLKEILDNEAAYINGMALLCKCCDVIGEMHLHNIDVTNLTTKFETLETSFYDNPNLENFNCLKDFYNNELLS
jgi:hypothetical protein